MSITIMSMLWGCKFGNPSLLLIAQKLADVANDDGTSIYPANQTVADAVGASKRSVQRYKKIMQEAGLLVQVREGGFGREDTSEYRYDMTILKMLHEQDFTFDELLSEARSCQKRRQTDTQTNEEHNEKKGDSLTPLKSTAKAAKGDTRGKLRVTPVVNKGDRAVSPDSSGPILNPPTQDAREVKSRKHSEKAVERVCVDFDDLGLQENEQRVVDLLIRPLVAMLRPSKQSTPDLWKIMAQSFQGFSDEVLKRACTALLNERSVFPTIAIARQFCEKEQDRVAAGVPARWTSIKPGSKQWQVWRSYLRRNNKRYSLKIMDQVEASGAALSVDADQLDDLMADSADINGERVA